MQRRRQMVPAIALTSCVYCTIALVTIDARSLPNTCAQSWPHSRATMAHRFYETCCDAPPRISIRNKLVAYFAVNNPRQSLQFACQFRWRTGSVNLMVHAPRFASSTGFLKFMRVCECDHRPTSVGQTVDNWRLHRYQQVQSTCNGAAKWSPQLRLRVAFIAR